MATAVMQLALLPFYGARIARSLNECDSFANPRSSNITAIDSPHGVKFRNGASCSSKCVCRRDRSCGGYGDKRQGSRRISLKKLCVSRCSAEKAAYAVKEVTDEDLEKQVQPDDIRVLAAIRSR